MYDEHRRLILCNDRYAEMFHLPHELTTPGTALGRIFDHQVSHRLHPASGPDEYIRGMMAIITACKPASTVTEFSDGRAMVTVFRPAPGGAFVTTVEDITEQRRAEKRIAHIAHHDSLTGLHNRAAFSDWRRPSMRLCARPGRSRFCVWTSTISRRSTTFTAIWSAMRFCARWRGVCMPSRKAPSWHALAGTSSS
jgi:PAS fold